MHASVDLKMQEFVTEFWDPWLDWPQDGWLVADVARALCHASRQQAGDKRRFPVEWQK